MSLTPVAQYNLSCIYKGGTDFFHLCAIIPLTKFSYSFLKIPFGFPNIKTYVSQVSLVQSHLKTKRLKPSHKIMDIDLWFKYGKKIYYFKKQQGAYLKTLISFNEKKPNKQKIHTLQLAPCHYEEDSFSVDTLNRKAYLFGGKDRNTLTNRFWEFDLKTLKWCALISPLPKFAKSRHLAFCFNGLFIAIGGGSKSSIDLILYDIKKKRWVTNNLKHLIFSQITFRKPIIDKNQLLLFTNSKKDEFRKHSCFSLDLKDLCDQYYKKGCVERYLFSSLTINDSTIPKKDQIRKVHLIHMKKGGVVFFGENNIYKFSVIPEMQKELFYHLKNFKKFNDIKFNWK